MHPQIEGLTISGSEDNDLNIATDIRATSSSIVVNGKGNKITISSGCVLTNVRIVMESDDNTLFMGPGVRFCGAIFQKKVNGNQVYLGARSTFGQVNIICGEGRRVQVGEDCMFAWNIEVRTTDSHAVFDRDSNERLNPGSDIIIGDHVWIAAKSHLMKKTRIPNGCVVSMGSLTNAQFDEEACIVGGVPAKVIRRNVRWERELLG